MSDNLWGLKELDLTEQLNIFTFIHFHFIVIKKSKNTLIFLPHMTCFIGVNVYIFKIYSKLSNFFNIRFGVNQSFSYHDGIHCLLSFLKELPTFL